MSGETGVGDTGDLCTLAGFKGSPVREKARGGDVIIRETI